MLQVARTSRWLAALLLLVSGPAALRSASGIVPPARLAADPAVDLAGVRAFITTTSATLDLTLEHATLANAVFETRGGAELRTSHSGNTLRIAGNTTGQTADVRVDLVLAGVVEDSRIAWLVEQALSGATTIEIHNQNASATMLVDRFAATDASARFVTDTDLLRARGPLARPEPVTPKVLAFFYPWFDLPTWASPELLDLPLRLYSTDDAEYMMRTARLARAAGLDALAVSWQGKAFDGGWNHRRMLIMLDAARAAGLSICALLETTVANPQHDQANTPPDPSTVLAWLTDIVDSYGNHPAYLRQDGRPVVFAYAAQRLSPAQWDDVRGRLRASGRDVLLIGEGSNNTRLGSLDGLFFYGSNVFQGDTVREFHRSQSLYTRTYHLVPNGGPRRLWVATVSPGYDDTRLRDGRVPRVTPREDGRYYDTQWQSALDMRADWIVITSWNEWWENTHIEPSRFFGTSYLERTQGWAARYRRGVPEAGPR